MKAVQSVIVPNATVMEENQILGPNRRTAIVAGSWKVIDAMVKMKMLMLNLFPYRPRSSGIEVTEAEEMTPESSRLREQRIPAIVHKRRSTLRRRRCSSCSVSMDGSSPFGGGLGMRLLVSFGGDG